jgi:hypothetical protein
VKKTYAEMVAAVGDLPPGPLAVPVKYDFVPRECTTEYLIGFLKGDYDSMNDGDDARVASERELARLELKGRGITVVGHEFGE